MSNDSPSGGSAGRFLSSMTKSFDVVSDSATKLLIVSDNMKESSENFRIASENGKIASDNFNQGSLVISDTLKHGLNTLSFSIAGSTLVWAAVTLIKLRKK